MKFVDFKPDSFVCEEVKRIIDMMQSIIKEAHKNKKFAPLKEVMVNNEELLSRITVNMVNATHKYIRSKDHIESPEVAHALLDRVFGAAVIFFDLDSKKKEEEDGA